MLHKGTKVQSLQATAWIYLHGCQTFPCTVQYVCMFAVLLFVINMNEANLYNLCGKAWLFLDVHHSPLLCVSCGWESRIELLMVQQGQSCATVAVRGQTMSSLLLHVLIRLGRNRETLEKIVGWVLDMFDLTSSGHCSLCQSQHVRVCEAAGVQTSSYSSSILYIYCMSVLLL